MLLDLGPGLALEGCPWLQT